MHYVLARARSFRYASSGIFHLLRTQPNARLHVVASLLVLGAAAIFRLPRSDWLWLLAASGSVWAAEAMNTAVELLADALCPDHHPLIGRAKDVAAAAVLLVALTASAIAVCIFGPHLVQMLPR